MAIAEDSDAMLATGMAYIPANVAEALGIPYRMVVFCPQIYPSVYHPPPSGAAPRGRRLLNALLWWGMEGWFDRAVGPVLNPWRCDRGLNAGSGFYRRMVGVPTERLLSADEELAPLPPDVAVMRRVSAIRTAQTDSLPDEVESFLALGAPPVYVGFGSVPAGDADRLLDLVLESAACLDVRTIVPASWVSAAGRDIPTGCLAVGHVPHDVLFPRLAAVVHHGGAGTTTVAARAGVPQVVIPHLTDQYYWGHRVCELGIGPGPLNYSRLRASTLTAALHEALNSPTIAERARALHGSTNGRDGAVELATLLCEDMFATPGDNERQRTRL